MQATFRAPHSYNPPHPLPYDLPPRLLPHFDNNAATSSFQNHCGQFADKYVEFDAVLLTLDVILHKTSVYRHVLHNVHSRRSGTGMGTLQEPRVMLGALLVDTYVKWFYMTSAGTCAGEDKGNVAAALANRSESYRTPLACSGAAPLWVMLFGASAAESLACAATIMLVSLVLAGTGGGTGGGKGGGAVELVEARDGAHGLPRGGGAQDGAQYEDGARLHGGGGGGGGGGGRRRPSWRHMGAALVAANFCKIFFILLHDLAAPRDFELDAVRLINVFVATSTVVAVAALLNISAPRATVIVALGTGAKVCVQWATGMPLIV